MHFFNKNPQKVYKYSELTAIFTINKKNWGIPANVTCSKFLETLLEKSNMSIVILPFPNRREVRYFWGASSDFEIALSLRPNCYLSHHSAVYINNLIEEIPSNIYVNQEQPPKKTVPGILQQERIDFALSRECRVTKTKARVDKKTFWILNGMNTGQYGVVDSINPQGKKLRSTNLERTLIDISVRPVYSGGVKEVLKAFSTASDKISINALIYTLKTLNYTYPYHQVLGFYLDRVGVDGSLILKEFEMKNDFYLTHHMIETLYSKKWHLYYPKELG